MKNNIIKFLVITFTFSGSLTSCNYLDVENVLSQTETIDSLFQKKEGVETLLANIYSYVPDNLNGMIYEIVWEGASDDLDMPYKYSSSKDVKLGQNGPDSYVDKPWINYWKYAYQAIRAANVYVSRVESCADPRISKEKLLEYKREAKFLRSYFYFLLVQQYGPFIIVPNEAIDLETPTEKLPKVRSTYDECIEFLTKELDESIKELPDSYAQDNDFGRPTKGVAMAVKSRLLLYSASPQYNGNTSYSSFVRKVDGKMFMNQVYDSKKWEIAARASKNLIDLAESGSYKLHTVPRDSKTPQLPFINAEGDYPNGPGGIDPFRSYKELFCGNPDTKWITEEVIWARPKTNPENFVRHVTPRGMGKDDWAGLGVGQGLVDSYFMSDGRTISEAMKTGDYKETLENSSVAGYYTTSGINIRYLNREPRFYASVSFNHSRYKNYNGATTPWYYIDFMGSDIKNADNYVPTGHLLRKFTDPELECRADGVRHRGAILFRLAEIYLNYVEALNEYDPGNADIKKYLNLIRYRGGIKGYSAAQLNSQNVVREIIHRERRIELAFEMHRYFDSRRWKEAELTTKDEFGNSLGQGGEQYGMNMGAKTSEEFFKRTLLEKRFFASKSYLWPIPTSDITNNPLLDQNPGW